MSGGVTGTHVGGETGWIADENARDLAILQRGVFVDHGSTAGTVRPSSSVPVKWFGTVAPTNTITNDEWYDRANEILKRYDGSTWQSAGSATYTPLAREGTRIPSVTNPLLGGSDLLIGVNLVGTPTHYNSYYHGWFARLWMDIVQDGTASASWTWLKAQIDAVRGSATKANSIRLISAIGGIQAGLYTMPQYLAVWKIITDYCRSVGVSVYASPAGSWLDFNFQAAWATTPGASTTGDVAAWPTSAHISDMATACLALQQMGNVVGIDVVQEYVGNYPPGGTVGDATTALQGLFAAIRAAGCVVPLTASAAVFSSAGWAGEIATEATFMDFIDRHVYYNYGDYDGTPPMVYPTTAEITAMYASMGSLPLVLGEGGLPQTALTADRTTYFTALGNLLKGGRVAGAFAWAAADQSSSSADKWGMFSGSPGGSLTARTDVTAPFLAWPRRRQPTALRRYNGSAQTLSGGGYNALELPTLDYDYGGLGFGNLSTGPHFYIPEGLGGLYRVSFAIPATGGGTGGAIDCLLVNNADYSQILLTARPDFASGETVQASASGVLDLPGGFTGLIRVYATQTATTLGGQGRTWLSVERVGPF